MDGERNGIWQMPETAKKQKKLWQQNRSRLADGETAKNIQPDSIGHKRRKDTTQAYIGRADVGIKSRHKGRRKVWMAWLELNRQRRHGELTPRAKPKEARGFVSRCPNYLDAMDGERGGWFATMDGEKGGKAFCEVGR